MREVSCRPVRSDEDMLTGAPRCSRMLTLRSRSMPDTGRGEVLAAGHRATVRPGPPRWAEQANGSQDGRGRRGSWGITCVWRSHSERFRGAYSLACPPSGVTSTRGEHAGITPLAEPKGPE